MTVKLLTDSVFPATTDSDEREAIFQLRKLVPKLTTSEIVTLVAVLVNSYSVKFGRKVGLSAIQAFGSDLADAVLQIHSLLSNSKILIAMELLEMRLLDKSQEPGDTLP